MTEKTTGPIADDMGQATESSTEDIAPLEQVTIEVSKAKGAVKSPRKATVLIMQSGMSEKYGMVRLACSPKGNIWYVVTEHPVEGSTAPAPHRHEREAVKAFNRLCRA